MDESIEERSDLMRIPSVWFTRSCSYLKNGPFPFLQKQTTAGDDNGTGHDALPNIAKGSFASLQFVSSSESCDPP
jgi:hypothetical protein